MDNNMYKNHTKITNCDLRTISTSPEFRNNFNFHFTLSINSSFSISNQMFQMLQQNKTQIFKFFQICANS